LGRWLEPVPSAAGLHLAALAKPGLDVDALIERARRQDVGVYSLREYCIGNGHKLGLVLGYGAIDQPLIAEALSRLRRVLQRA